MLHCAGTGPISFLPAAALPRSPQCPYLIPQEETNYMCLCLDWQLEYVGDRPLKMRHNSKLFFIHCLLNREVHIFPETVVCLLQEKTISLPSAVVLFERGESWFPSLCTIVATRAQCSVAPVRMPSSHLFLGGEKNKARKWGISFSRKK